MRAVCFAWQRGDNPCWWRMPGADLAGLVLVATRALPPRAVWQYAWRRGATRGGWMGLWVALGLMTLISGFAVALGLSFVALGWWFER